MEQEVIEVEVLERLKELFAGLGEEAAEPGPHFREVVRVCAELVRAESCSLWLQDRTSGAVQLRGAYGYTFIEANPAMSADDIANQFSYDPYGRRGEPGVGVTGAVFIDDEPSRATSSKEVEEAKEHEGWFRGEQSNYDMLWRQGDEEVEIHPCFSWYQFPVKLGPDRPVIGVLKVENKLDESGTPVPEGGFTSADERVVEILGNGAVPIITLFSELHGANERSRGAGAFGRLQSTDDLDGFFNPAVLEQIGAIAPEKVRDEQVHAAVKDFIERIDREKKYSLASEPLVLARTHIESIAEALELPPELVGYIQPLADYQQVLYRLVRYREHFLHQLNVFLLGYLILHLLEEPEFAYLARQVEEGASKRVLQTWFLASMWHDTGYPLGKADQWTNELATTLFKLDAEPDENVVIKVTEPVAVLLLRNGAFDWLNDLLDGLHEEFAIAATSQPAFDQIVIKQFVPNLGDDVVAALLLLKAGADQEVEHRLLRVAAAAIASHDSAVRDELKPIEFNDHPFAFLLYYCDCVQEHGRLRSDESSADWEVTETTVIRERNGIRAQLRYTAQPANWETVKAALGADGAYTSPDYPFTIDAFFGEEPNPQTIEFHGGRRRRLEEPNG